MESTFKIKKQDEFLVTSAPCAFFQSFLILGCHAASQSEVEWESHSRFASSAEAAGVATDVSGHWSMEVDRTRWNPFGLEQLLKQPNRFCQQDRQLIIYFTCCHCAIMMLTVSSGIVGGFAPGDRCPSAQCGSWRRKDWRTCSGSEKYG